MPPTNKDVGFLFIEALGQAIINKVVFETGVISESEIDHIISQLVNNMMEKLKR